MKKHIYANRVIKLKEHKRKQYSQKLGEVVQNEFRAFVALFLVSKRFPLGQVAKN